MGVFLKGSGVLSFFADALGTPGRAPRICRTGARLSGPACGERLIWHHHQGRTGRTQSAEVAVEAEPQVL